MKKLLAVVFMSVLFVSAMAQNPVPDSDTVPNPLQQGDPALRTLPPRLDYVEDRRLITSEELPDPVRQTLESSAQYKDWQQATLFHDSNKDEYIVEFKRAEKTTAYRFNKDGTAIVED